jgi:homoserine dehydrogenase
MSLMSAVVEARPAPDVATTAVRAEARIALLGLGVVGGAIADLLAREPDCVGRRARIDGALVRHAGRRPDAPCPLVEDVSTLLDGDPDVVIEVLGGVEPARTIVVSALERGIPVVTANKSLLAAHADEILDASRRSGASVHLEAAVLAGIPFLGTFGRRGLASRVRRITAILNGTTNFVLTRLQRGESIEDAVADAQRLGFAEPDPSKDLGGQDAAEKLAVLIRQFAGARVHPAQIHTTSIAGVTPADLSHARELGGTLKPVSFAEWHNGDVSCFTGPAFLGNGDPLAHVEGVLNGIRLERDDDPLCFTGPGAGPRVTARTILDDVAEVLSGNGATGLREAIAPSRVTRPSGDGWFVRLSSPTRLPFPDDVSDLLGSHGVWTRRWGAIDSRTGDWRRYLLTFPVSAAALESGLRALSAASACQVRAFPVVDGSHE